MSVSITVEGANELAAALGQNFQPVFQAASLAVGEELRGKMAKAPGPVKRPVRWASEKQRRWYHAARQAAGLPPGYRRMTDAWSENLEGSWTTERKGSMGAIVETRTSYAPWVQSSDKQQPMHAATGWITDQRAVDEVVASGVADRIFGDAVEKAL